MERFLLVAQYARIRSSLRERQMEMIIAGAEQVACTIFERLGLELPGAQLDYESFNGIHNFIIAHAGTRFRIQFAEQTLLTRSMEQLQKTICKIAERVLCNATLRALQNTHRYDP
jgi:hypothetical protein